MFKKRKSYRELEIAYNTLENKVEMLQDIVDNQLIQTLENNNAKTVKKYQEENRALRKKIKILKEMYADEHRRNNKNNRKK